MKAPSGHAANKRGDLLRRMKKYKSSYAFIAPFMLIFLTFSVVPVLIAIVLGFTSFNVLEPPKFILFENYQNLFLHDPLFELAFKNTIILSVVVGVVGYFLCLLIAWYLNDFPPRLRAFLTLLFYAPTLANVFFVWQLIFNNDSYGLLNAYLLKLGVVSQPVLWLNDERTIIPVLILILLWASLGTSFLVMIAGFQNVDFTLYEAGAVDGIRNRWQELWYITLPYMRPQLMFAAVSSITSSFTIIAPIIDALCGNPSTNYSAWTIVHHLKDYGGPRMEMGYACCLATILFVLMVSINQGAQKLLSKVGR